MSYFACYLRPWLTPGGGRYGQHGALSQDAGPQDYPVDSRHSRSMLGMSISRRHPMMPGFQRVAAEHQDQAAFGPSLLSH